MATRKGLSDKTEGGRFYSAAKIIDVHIETERLFIEPLVCPMTRHIIALNDKEHMRFSEQRRRTHTPQTQFEYILSNQRAGNIVVNLRPKDPMANMGVDISATIGTMSAIIDRPNKLVDMGIMILPSAVGQGYGLEAWKAVLNYWLTDGGMDKVEAGCHELNTAMRLLCVKSGMREEGFRHDHFRNDDLTRSGAVYYGKVR